MGSALRPFDPRDVRSADRAERAISQADLSDLSADVVRRADDDLVVADRDLEHSCSLRCVSAVPSAILSAPASGADASADPSIRAPDQSASPALRSWSFMRSVGKAF